MLEESLLIEVNEIKKMMDLLSNLFLIRTSFVYAIDQQQYTGEIAGNNGDYQDYCKLIQKELKHKCIACDLEKFKVAKKEKRPVLYRCFSGLYEMFLPLFISDVLVGYLHFGQVRAEDNFETIMNECSLEDYSKPEDLKRSYNSMVVIPKERLVLISELFLNFSKIILNNKLIELKKASPEYYLKRYIDENLDKRINVKTAADTVGRSPSYVTHRFKEFYGKTFHSYLNHARVEYAKKLLLKHNICETYQQCGFNNRFHFSKNFKNIVGITPFEYQNNNADKKTINC